MKQLNVKINDENGDLVNEYIIKRLSVISNSRWVSLNKEVEKLELDDYTKNQLFASAALAATLCNVEGELIFPDEDGAMKVAEEMDIAEYKILTEAYLEINPLESNLDAKKKKS